MAAHEQRFGGETVLGPLHGRHGPISSTWRVMATVPLAALAQGQVLPIEMHDEIDDVGEHRLDLARGDVLARETGPC